MESRSTTPRATSLGGYLISTKIRHQAASLALGATIGLTVFKLIVAYFSGSVGVLSEAIHSFLDLISAMISYFTVREAGKPADENHPFGHGKIETVSSLFESLLLVVAAALIVFESVAHLRNPQPLQFTGMAMAAMGVSIVVSYWVYRHNLKASRETESSALHVNALHFLSDIVASIGILIGLVILHFTGWWVVDGIAGLLVAAYIVIISARQVKGALHELTDTQLPEREITVIKGLLDTFRPDHIEAHNLRTRKSGATRHIDFHLVLCGGLTVNESHEVCDQMEAKILSVYENASVNIHVEPCSLGAHHCHSKCDIYGKRKGLIEATR